MKQATKPEQAKHRSKIGGQALIEGVMMKGVHTGAMACRLPDGTIDVETWEEHNGKEMPWYRKCPFVRGSFNFVISMRDGYRCLMKSAEKQMTEEEKENEPQEEMNRFERWLNDKLGDKVFSICRVRLYFPAKVSDWIAHRTYPHSGRQPIRSVTAGRRAENYHFLGLHGIYWLYERHPADV